MAEVAHAEDAMRITKNGRHKAVRHLVSIRGNCPDATPPQTVVVGSLQRKITVRMMATARNPSPTKRVEMR